MKPGAIIGLVIGSVAILTAIGLLVYFFVLREKLFKKQIRELDKKYQFLHALLIGQDAQYVKRLEIISRTNLLYVETHTKFLKKFKEIRDKYDAESESVITDLRDLLLSKEIKLFKERYIESIAILENYDQQVSTFNTDLNRVVKPEEDCRQSALIYKEQLRRIKQDYYSKESELVLMADSFDEVFKHIDKQFEEFEGLVESAHYDEANTILPEIDGILHEVTSKINELPSLCTMISIVVPEKISSVENAFKDMISKKYPLYHLCVNQTIEEIRNKLEAFTHRVRIFDIAGISEELDKMTKELDVFFEKFDEEKAARESFEGNNENVYSTVNLIERNFIKLRNTIPEVAKYFIINEEHKTKINDIQTDINKVGALKRSLDTFIHSATKQPYTLLVGKMNELSTAANTIISAIEEFNDYIASLKSDAEGAYSVVYSFYEKTKKAEFQVREMNIKKITEKYQPKFEELYNYFNTIYENLVTSPIDIDKVNASVHEVYEIANKILDDGDVNQDYNMMMLAESTILFANRHRNHLSDIESTLDQAETQFDNGEFEKAYVMAANVLKKIKESNGR